MRESKTRRLVATVVLMMATVGATFATGAQEGETATTMEAPLPVRYVVPDSPQPELDVVEGAVSEAMQADGLDLTLEVIHIERTVLDDRLNVMFASGEPFELLHIMENRRPSTVFINAGQLRPIDDLVDQYFTDSYDRFSEGEWAAGQVNGVQYTVPAAWKAQTRTGSEAGWIGARIDKLEQYGYNSFPETKDELFDMLADLKEQVDNPRAYFWQGAPQAAQVWLNRTHDSYPFFVDYGSELFYVTEDGRVESWIETAEFAENARFMRRLYEADLIHPDWITLPPGVESSLGQFALLTALGTDDPPEAPEDEELGFFLRPDTDVYVSIPVLNANGVSTTTEHPETGIQFLNWLYAERENHDLFLHGIEGRHYERVSDRLRERVVDSTEQPLYSFRYWQIGYRPWRMFDPGIHPKSLEYQTSEHPTTTFHLASAFRFDPTPVEAEYQNVIAEWDRSILPIKMGNQDYDDAFENALDRMKDAGLDTVVDEYREQFDEWYATVQ